MNACSHLPNAAHIDRIIESVKSHTKVWDAAYNAAWEAAQIAARDEAYNVARGEAWFAASDAARNAAYYAARVVASGAARGPAWLAASGAAWGAILALIAYDDAAKYLNMSVDQLKMWAILSEEPAAILLLPAVIAFEKISVLELA
jgi:hypothetical protein